MTSRQRRVLKKNPVMVMAGSFLPRPTYVPPQPPQSPPKSRKPILVHECHSQLEGQPKPSHCECSERISRKEAQDQVDKGHADWQATTRKDGVVQVSKSAIVMHSSAKDVQEGFVILRNELTEKKKLQNAIAEAYALNKEQADIMKRTRRFLNIEYVQGHLSFDPVNLSDADIHCSLTCGRKELSAQLRPVAAYNLDALACEFDLFILKRDGNGLTAGGDTAAGLWPDGEVSGEMTTKKLDQLSAHARRADGGDGTDNDDGVKIPAKAGRPAGHGPESEL
jgi:hypothetical protein